MIMIINYIYVEYKNKKIQIIMYNVRQVLEQQYDYDYELYIKYKNKIIIDNYI